MSEVAIENKEIEQDEKTCISTELIESPAGLTICASPFLCGEEIVKYCQDSTTDFLKALTKKSALDDPVVLDILMGGRHYYLKKIWSDLFPRKKLGHAEVRASRYLGDDKNWGVRIWYDAEAAVANQDAEDPFKYTKDLLRNAKTLIIGDTLATGTTMTGILKWILDLRSENPSAFDVEIFSIAGSEKCLDNVSKLIPSFQKQKWKVRFWFANQSFNLADNGTDLEFIGARMLPSAKAFYDQRLGDFQKKMKCGIWDWGDRCSRVKSHLAEIEEYYHSQDNVPSFILEGIETAMKKYSK